ncbi:NAD(P)/FAD-dependent oxidoreductase [Cecembia calidifontis]|jgi:flavin-dependent dehydrogenase|uniref:Flavin-dependent dehydrogenase n=1 Tax=Cecembia calidifontis TaxID=1187080 RepID=A0A4Q7P6R4_9BACT|nr:FAD-dependent oxidoreductase [Cecembia calidifontis]RZS95170.1 flavin-dependent dehydrogenase [Cecembia calidifontis]
MAEQFREIIIIGGGLAGLIAAHQLSKSGKEVLLIEKKNYPFHRVCGEYISNEVRGFLIRESLFPKEFFPAEIGKFRLSSVKGEMAEMDLDMGGFGISRYVLDEFLFHKSKTAGAEFLLQAQAESIDFLPDEDRFRIVLNDGRIFYSKHVLGAFGKRSKIDKYLDRNFIRSRSPYIGVKYHIRIDYEKDLVALHNFEGGYCGINRIEQEKFNLCYLGSKDHLRKYGNIQDMEKEVLYKNPHLKTIFENAEFLFEKPEVINEVDFSPKLPVENHILMLGDAAGLITPLCGNGMAIAIHSGKIAAEILITNLSRPEIEKAYLSEWSRQFKSRLWLGRRVQWLFGANKVSDFAVSLVRNSGLIARAIMKNTHGPVIK